MLSRKGIYPAAIVALMVAAGLGGAGAAFLTFNSTTAEQAGSIQRSNAGDNSDSSGEATVSTDSKADTALSNRSMGSLINGTSELTFLSEADIEKLNDDVWKLVLSKGYSADECLWVRTIGEQDYPFYVTTSNKSFFEVNRNGSDFSIKWCIKPDALFETDNARNKEREKGNMAIEAFRVELLEDKIPKSCVRDLPTALESYCKKRGQAIKPSSITLDMSSVGYASDFIEFNINALQSDGVRKDLKARYSEDKKTFSFISMD